MAQLVDESCSIIAGLEEQSGVCGYCSSSLDRKLGGWAETLTVDEYQYLLERGWRRSGCYLYHPINHEICCPQYSIRLDAHSFRPSKDQKRVKRKFEEYVCRTQSQPSCAPATAGLASSLPGPSKSNLSADWSSKEASSLEANQPRPIHSAAAVNETPLIDSSIRHSDQSAHDQAAKPTPGTKLAQAAAEQGQSCLHSELIRDALAAAVSSGSLPHRQYCSPKLSTLSPKQCKRLPAGVQLTSAIAFPVAAAANKGSDAKIYATQVADMLASMINIRLQTGNADELWWSSWSVQSAQGHLNFICTDASNQGDTCMGDQPAADSQPLRQDGQHPSQAPIRSQHPCARHSQRQSQAPRDSPDGQSARSAEPASTSRPSSQRIQPSFETRWVKMPCSQATLQLELPLFQKYQMRQHKETCPSMSAFQRFLVETPLVEPGSAIAPGPGPLQGYGTYHEQYWLDGVLIALAVLDVLPGYLSSVYFIWEPDLPHLCLGKLSALREIEWTRAQSACPGGPFPALRHYCMGYYIHSCPKMRYKASFQPSQLLCPETFAWVPLDAVKSSLNACKYLALSQLPGAMASGSEAHSKALDLPQDQADQVPDDEVGSTQLLLVAVPPKAITYAQLLALCMPKPGQAMRRQTQELIALQPKLRRWRWWAGRAADTIIVAI